LRLVRNYKSKDISNEEKEKTQRLEVMLLLRKGNSLLHQNKKIDAVQQYEKALELEPGNEIIRKDLEKMRN
jgi:predicted negative regulator of RcsB-dependent stress response